MIPGDQARRYLDRIEPKRVEADVWGLLYGALTFLALGLIGLSVLIPQTAGSREEARQMGFGEPLAFVYPDAHARLGFTSTTPTTYYFNPMEDTATVSYGRFFLAWGLATLVLVGPVLLIRWLWARGRTQRGHEA